MEFEIDCSELYSDAEFNFCARNIDIFCFEVRSSEGGRLRNSFLTRYLALYRPIKAVSGMLSFTQRRIARARMWRGVK